MKLLQEPWTGEADLLRIQLEGIVSFVLCSWHLPGVLDSAQQTGLANSSASSAIDIYLAQLPGSPCLGPAAAGEADT